MYIHQLHKYILPNNHKTNKFLFRTFGKGEKKKRKVPSAKGHSRPSQTSKIEIFFAKIVNGWNQLTIFVESFISDI